MWTKSLLDSLGKCFEGQFTEGVARDSRPAFEAACSCLGAVAKSAGDACAPLVVRLFAALASLLKDHAAKGHGQGAMTIVIVNATLERVR